MEMCVEWSVVQGTYKKWNWSQNASLNQDSIYAYMQGR